MSGPTKAGSRRSERVAKKKEEEEEEASADPSAASTPGRPKKKTKVDSSRKKKVKKQHLPTINSFTDESLDALLKSLPAGDDNIRGQYAARILQEAAAKAAEMDSVSGARLNEWVARFYRGAKADIPLGSRIATLGYGSMAGIEPNATEIAKVITSCAENHEDRKGRMLSHFFYRAFLKHIHNANNGFGIADNEARKDRFKNKCSLIWQDTDTGLVRTKRDDGNTHEPCATSLLTPCINKAIHVLTSDNDGMPDWANELPLIGSGAPKAAAKQTKSRKGKQQDEGSKQPRCDGLLVMPDPLENNSLRALVMMEAKIGNFVTADKYQSKSNTVDAFSRQPKGKDAWPLLVFRATISNSVTRVDVFALVPTSATEAILVPMWKSNDPGSLYDAVMASVLAAQDFREEIVKKDRQLMFCRTGHNVAIDDSEKQVFKSFFSTNRRKVNLHLIQGHVDENATEIQLGDKGSYVQMNDVGTALPAEVEVGKFVDIANSLAAAHSENDTCHGDVRLDNMILESGTLIDWDLAGKENETHYPKGMNDIVDGERHPAVKKAIQEGTIGELTLSKDHDWYSLKAVMQLFEPTDNSKNGAWTHLVDNIAQDGERAKARSSFSLALNEPNLKN